MIETLDDHYVELQAKLGTMRALCRAGVPDCARLAHARHQLMAISMRRSSFLKDTVFPALAAADLPGVAAGIAALDRDLAEKRVAVSGHIAAWPLDRIAGDWAGYRAASARVAAGIADRVRREQALLYPALTALLQRQRP
ncbi:MULTISPECIES: hypothetical protein [unclassified Sphingomonas]|jgi:hypothetical protein|uniref:hypothetical protein n=1 Tax=unclassified Sphingomonas TaxID=196159 RepID=UPI000DBBD78B|nr:MULTISPECIES: hypothetical protein [unclassified Sphingomonas]PZT91376.1 MAG: hypothetical protein DI625_15740 [Sphingomonas sp.]RSV21988.1 hypothetical protein CA237_15800 [Sphingomonas sp. ABOLH]